MNNTLSSLDESDRGQKGGSEADESERSMRTMVWISRSIKRQELVDDTTTKKKILFHCIYILKLENTPLLTSSPLL